MISEATYVVALALTLIGLFFALYTIDRQSGVISRQKDEIFNLEKRAESAEDQVVASLNAVQQAQQIVDRATTSPAIYSVTCPFDDYLEVVTGMSPEVALEQAAAALRSHNELAGHMTIPQQRLMN